MLEDEMIASAALGARAASPLPVRERGSGELPAPFGKTAPVHTAGHPLAERSPLESGPCVRAALMSWLSWVSVR
jgi:hypothetical protein